MLKLKRVDIHGFKSFYDRTEMKFHGSGIAAVVGPNGCGKSNISDAISWVLGEQSAKSLRGIRMEDVIFAGTRERKPLGMAQVTLTMVDPSGHLAIPGATPERPASEKPEPANGAVNGHTHGHGHGHGHAHRPHDITITRRLYRSGESEYLINGKSARLRDIQDLFSGTGLGPESYAIIEQGRIGQILSNKPADRRAVIEEAAGIGKFKTKKRLAEAKLESAKQNLSRVFDILEEVSRQVNSLKRQASKARRYEELRTEMIAHLKQSVAGRFRVLERDAAKLALDLGAAQSAFENLSTETTQKEQEHTTAQTACYMVEENLKAARSKIADLNVEAERTRGRLESQAKQIGAIDERLVASEAETQGLDGRLNRDRSEVAWYLENAAKLETEAVVLRERLNAKTAERDNLHADLRQRAQKLEASRAQVLRLLSEASNLRNQLAQIDEYLAAVERDSTRIRKDEESASADLTRLDEVKNQLSERLMKRQMELESLADRRQRVESGLQEQRSATTAARAQLDELREGLSRQKARRDSLGEILSHRAYTTETVKRLFTAVERGQTGDFKPTGVFADYVEVTNPAWEKACETFLHDELEYVVVNSWDDAHNGVQLVRADADGQATFLVHQGVNGVSGSVDLDGTPGVAGRLRDVLRLSNGFASAADGLLPRVARCFLVEDRTAAEQLATKHPDSYFLLADGLFYHGPTVSGGRKNVGGPLALKRELREITTQVEAQERTAEVQTSALEGLERGVALLNQELEEIRHLQQTQEKDALALDHEQRKLAEEYARAGSRVSAARLELDRLVREDQKSREQRQQSQALVAEKDNARFDQEKALELERSEFEGVQTHSNTVSEEHAVLRAELAGSEERARSEKTAAARLQSQIQMIEERRAEIGRDLERMGVERARLLADNVELDKRAAELADIVVAAQQDAARLAEEAIAGRAALAALEETLKALRSEASAAQERRAATEVDLVRKQAELKYLDETSRKELNTAAEEVAAGFEGEVDDLAVTESETRYQEVRNKIESLGPVNTQALQEYEEAQHRYDFLNTQRQDLLDSIRDTEKAISELDTESRRRFKDAFEVINENFKAMFKTLFGGGQGEMRLTDETNLAESGIDIMASPPGKKLQNIALLSGGEKSLTAMALLMAIFRYTPSPFCILDEVDAPLDEANITRLSRLLKEMSDETQFIVITHAKRTMEASQALYGVTMQEPGISTLVSVRFDHPVAATPEPSTAAMATV